MKILLVDDDSSIIQALLPLLRADGHEVRVATTGAKALEHANAWSGCEVLLTDVVMDPMDGFTLNAEVRALLPAVRTIFITGYDLSDYAAQTEGHLVLAKPVEAEALRAALGSGESAPPETRAAENGELAPGQQVGAYQIVRKIADGRRSTLFEAIQTAMKRRVALRVLQPALQRDENAKMQFIADARARAGVQHPHILSVYEAGEIAGATFYAQEHVAGDHLAALAARGETISEPTALKAVGTVAEALAHFSTGRIPHAPLGAESIFLGEDARTRIANLATADGQQPEMAAEMKALAEAVRGVLPGGQAVDAGFQAMLQRMQLGKLANFPSWPALLQAVKTLEPRVIPADAGKIREKEIAAIRAVDMAKKRQKRTLILTIITFFILLWIVGLAVWWKFFHTVGKVFNKMLEVPAGEFIYQSGEKVTLPTFWIDQYEVTMAQYEQFLEALAAHPTTQYDHPKQPPGKSHVPKNWDIYWGRANAFSKSKQVVSYVAIDVNCPVFNVDWWDAYAYAKWKGHRLPTEQEWEKAARGTDGRQFPWGNEWDAKKCNSNKDYVAKAGPETKGTVDGYVWWSPVDAMTGDKSPYGVMGMAGNVIEWTDSWEENHTLPVLRGGSFASPDCLVTRRSAKLDPEGISESVGFRTVSDTPPAAK